MKFLLMQILTILMVVIASNCVFSQSDSDVAKVLSEIDNGKVTGSSYENKVIGIRIKFPKSMAPDSPASVAADTKEGLELLARDRSKADKQLIAEMLKNDRIVFTLDLPEDEDSLGAAMSLTIKKDEIKEPLIPMVDRTVKLFTSDGRGKVTQSPSEISLGPIQTVTFSISQQIDGVTVLSKLYTARRNGYLLTFSIAYADEIGLKTMDAVLKGIEGI